MRKGRLIKTRMTCSRLLAQALRDLPIQERKAKLKDFFRRVPRLGRQDARPTLPRRVLPRAVAHLTFCRGEFQEPFLLP
jgi:hypothetical protein